jgi:single-strand DNA-binding protein
MVNKVILIGNIGQEPTSRTTTSGKTVVSCSLATSMKRGGDTTTEWHRLVIWDKLAELVLQYVHKGSKVYVEGRLTYRKFTDKQGEEKETTEIVVSEVKFLDAKKPGDDSARAAEARYDQDDATYNW